MRHHTQKMPKTTDMDRRTMQPRATNKASKLHAIRRRRPYKGHNNE